MSAGCDSTTAVSLPVVVLILMDSRHPQVEEWKKVEAQYTSSVDVIVSADAKEVVNHPQFSKIAAITFSPFPGYQDALKTICGLLTSQLLWIHIWTAGVDDVLPFLRTLPPETMITNSRTAYSSILAEYVMAAILHFEKDIPRLLENRKQARYERFRISRVENKTLGVLGCGDIGKAKMLPC